MTIPPPTLPPESLRIAPSVISEDVTRDAASIGQVEIALLTSSAEELAAAGWTDWIDSVAETRDLILSIADQSPRRRVLALRLIEAAAPRATGATLGAFRPIVGALAHLPEQEAWGPAARARAAIAARDAATLDALRADLADEKVTSRRRRALAAALLLTGETREALLPRVRVILGMEPPSGRTNVVRPDATDLSMIGAALPELLASSHPLRDVVLKIIGDDPRPERCLVDASIMRGLFLHALRGHVDAKRLVATLHQKWRVQPVKRLNLAGEIERAAMEWFARAAEGDIDVAACPAEGSLALLHRARDLTPLDVRRLGAARLAASVHHTFVGSCEASQDVSRICPPADGIGAKAPPVSTIALAQNLLAMRSSASALAMRWWEPLLFLSGECASWSQHRARSGWEVAWDCALRSIQINDGIPAIYATRLRAIGLLSDALLGLGPAVAPPRESLVWRVMNHLASSKMLTDPRYADGTMKADLARLLQRIMDLPLKLSSQPFNSLAFALVWWELCHQRDETGSIWDRLLREQASTDRALADDLLALRAAVADAGHRDALREILSRLGCSGSMLDRALGDVLDAIETVESGRSDPTAATEALAGAAALWRDVVASHGVASRIANGEEFARLRRSTRGASSALGHALGARRDGTSVRHRDLVDRWADGMGPALAPRFEQAFLELSRRAPETPAPPKDRVGDYELLAPLGAGGMGEVFLARRLRTNADASPGRRPIAEGTLVALKRTQRTVIPAACDAPTLQASHDPLFQEVEVLMQVRHRNLVRYIDHGEVAGMPWLVMEYLEGVRLRDYVSARPLTVRELKPIVADIVSALGVLHAHGLAHRDLKPHNVMLSLDGVPPGQFVPSAHRDAVLFPLRQATLIDFGISSATHGGTFGYMAPESILGSPIPEAYRDRTDVYGLAATIYNAMTGWTFFHELPESDGIRLATTKASHPLLGRPHLQISREPLELLRAATHVDPKDRVDLQTFARAFSVL